MASEDPSSALCRDCGYLIPLRMFFSWPGEPYMRTAVCPRCATGNTLSMAGPAPRLPD